MLIEHRNTIGLTPNWRSARTMMLEFGLMLISALAGAQTILRSSETVEVGQPINILGDSFGPSPTVQFAVVDNSGNLGGISTLTSIASTDYFAQASVSPTASQGLWAVRVKNRVGGVSNWSYINRARPMMLSQEEAQLGSTFQIFGRNFLQPGQSSSKVQVQLTNSHQTFFAPIVSAAACSLTARVPNSAPPGTYQVLVTNGYGGPVGWAPAPYQLVIQPASDPFKLEVGWGGGFTFASNVYNIRTDSRLALHAAGDGVTNDAPALRNAIIQANRAGGGIVYLPSGTYRADDGHGMNLFSDVVLLGDGPTKSIIQFGYLYTPSNPPPSSGWMVGRGVDLVGISGLGFQNLNGSAAVNRTIELGFPGTTTTRCFLNNCVINLGNGNQMDLQSTTHAAILNTIISDQSITQGPLWLEANEDLTFQNSSVSYNVGRIEACGNLRTMFQANTFTRNTSYDVPGSPESGGIQTSYSRQLVLIGNTFQTTGAPETKGDADGEMIMSQQGFPDMEDSGIVTSATSTSLVDNTKNWTTTTPWTAPERSPFSRSMVAIVEGKGMGQWRLINSNTSTSIQINQPWDVLPDETSRYAIGSWSSDQHLYLNNTITGSNIGIEIYEGAWDTVIDGNAVLNDGFILLRGDSRIFDDGLNQIRVTPVWNSWIGHNSVIDSNAFRPAQISAASVVISGEQFGNLQLGTEIRDNYLQGMTPNISDSYQWGQGEGFWNSVVIEQLQTVKDPLATIGTLFSGNRFAQLSSPFNTTGSPQLTASSNNSTLPQKTP